MAARSLNTETVAITTAHGVGGFRLIARPTACDEYVCGMASVEKPGSVSRLIESVSRATDGFFLDPSTGNVVLVESPNAQMKALGLTLATSRALRGARVVETGDRVDIFLERAGMGLLIWWSIHEVRHGTTKYLKAIGALTLVGALARTILADPKYGLSPARYRISPRTSK
jgi:hypothetical protein